MALQLQPWWLAPLCKQKRHPQRKGNDDAIVDDTYRLVLVNDNERSSDELGADDLILLSFNLLEDCGRSGFIQWHKVRILVIASVTNNAPVIQLQINRELFYDVHTVDKNSGTIQSPSSTIINETWWASIPWQRGCCHRGPEWKRGRAYRRRHSGASNHRFRRWREHGICTSTGIQVQILNNFEKISIFF